MERCNRVLNLFLNINNMSISVNNYSFDLIFFKASYQAKRELKEMFFFPKFSKSSANNKVSLLRCKS